jgi:PPOX class probable F420-dependent enzyme
VANFECSPSVRNQLQDCTSSFATRTQHFGDNIPMSAEEVIKAASELFIGKTFAHLATVMPNGTPHVTPVWIDWDGVFVTFVSVKGRVKTRNIRLDPRVALEISDPKQPYRYVTVRGEVVEIRREGASEQLDRLSSRHLGVDKYPWGKPGDEYLMYFVKPTHAYLKEPL